MLINNELIKSYEKLVYKIISKYSNESNKEDLFQAGMIGILYASNKYDPKLNVKFSSFAYKYILGEVLRELREDRNIKISRDLIKDYKRIAITKERIYKAYGRPASITEISKILKIPEKRIIEVINYNEKELSLNMVVSDDEKLKLEDIIYNKDEIDKNDLINLKDAFECLEQSEKELLYKRYYENKTQTELANEYKSSQVKIYRYEKKVLNKLKDKML